MRYAAVLFDLFDTLVRFDRDRLPEVEVEGRRVRSTVGSLHGVLREHAPHVSLGEVHRALVESWKEAERQRAVDDREVPARQRFESLVARLGLGAGARPDGLVEDLLTAHGRELGRAACLPGHHRALLESLAEEFTLAVVSNFDHSPTALAILAEAGVAGLFSTIVVSDAVGWRKPSPAIFHEALRRVGVGPEAALFVGDRADIDVLGAQRVGMRVAWLNPATETLPAGVAAPDFEIRDLGELGGILRARTSRGQGAS